MVCCLRREFLNYVKTKLSVEDLAVYPLEGSKASKRSKLAKLYDSFFVFFSFRRGQVEL